MFKMKSPDVLQTNRAFFWYLQISETDILTCLSMKGTGVTIRTLAKFPQFEKYTSKENQHELQQDQKPPRLCTASCTKVHVICGMA